ncbi:MAG: 3'-5' exonuclease [Janthinobacterium lividum]
MPSYFLRTTGMSRGITDGTSKKNACTWHREYFRYDAGLLSSVSQFEDGLYFYSAPAALPAPKADASTAGAFEAAYTRCTAYLKKKEAERAMAKAFAKSLKDGMLFNAHAAEEADAAEPLQLVPAAAHFLDDFTVIDTETTGGSHAGADRLLEVAAVRYRHQQPVAQLQSFVRFAGEVPYRITQLTGITTAQVRRAPEAKPVLQRLHQLAGGSVLVGHNVGFDLRFLNAERARLGAPAPLPNDWLCTLAVASRRYPAPHKLGDLCRRFGLPTNGAHRALNDVLMCGALLLRMHAEQPIGPELLNQTGAGKRKPAAATATLFETAA